MNCKRSLGKILEGLLINLEVHFGELTIEYLCQFFLSPWPCQQLLSGDSIEDLVDLGILRFRNQPFSHS
jgi:hypothetical protein